MAFSSMVKDINRKIILDLFGILVEIRNKILQKKQN